MACAIHRSALMVTIMCPINVGNVTHSVCHAHRPPIVPNATLAIYWLHPRALAHLHAHFHPSSTTRSPAPASYAHPSATNALGTDMTNVCHVGTHWCWWAAPVCHSALVDISHPLMESVCNAIAHVNNVQAADRQWSVLYVLRVCSCICQLHWCPHRDSVLNNALSPHLPIPYPTSVSYVRQYCLTAVSVPTIP